MKRQIIEIDEDKCTGCGLCVPGCPEGALQIIDGKARLVSDLFCDGLGACIGDCPEGAIKVIEREAEPYDERKVMENIVKAGAGTVKAHLKHLKDHNQTEYLNQALEVLAEKGINPPSLEEKPAHHGGGCPGQMMRENLKAKKSPASAPAGEVPSELNQWPIQLALVNPAAPYFQNADLVIAADCTAFSYGNFHRDFLKEKTLVVFCPKLDTVLDQYVQKLSQIIKNNTIKSIEVVRMIVPCCSGAVSITRKALELSGKNLEVKETVISLEGEIMG